MSGFASRRPAPPARLLPVIDRGLCTGCGLCLAACPHGCLGFSWSLAELQDPGRCTGEALCVDACPSRLIEMKETPP